MHTHTHTTGKTLQKEEYYNSLAHSHSFITSLTFVFPVTIWHTSILCFAEGQDNFTNSFKYWKDILKLSLNWAWRKAQYKHKSTKGPNRNRNSQWFLSEQVAALGLCTALSRTSTAGASYPPPQVFDSYRTKWAEAGTERMNVCQIVPADSGKRKINYIVRERKSDEIFYTKHILKLQEGLETWLRR